VETAPGESRFDIEGRIIAAHFRADRGRFAVVKALLPQGELKGPYDSRVGCKLDFYRAVLDRVQQLRRRCS
jgi:exonuclease III